MLPPNHYNKQHKTSGELVAFLEAKNLVFADKALAEKFISAIGYSRLRIYLLSRRDKTQPDKPFLPGTTFDNIVELYKLDEHLRILAFECCSRFEIIFRNSISEALSNKHGPHPYRENIFRDDTCRREAMSTLIKVYYERLDKDDRAKHYYDKYAHPDLPPIWTLKEFLTFGNSSRLFKCLTDDLKVDVSQLMGINLRTHDVISSWIPAVNDLRNACAHHDRVFNRKFQKQPQNYKKGNILKKGKPEHLSGLIEIMDFVCSQFHPEQDFYGKLKAICDACPAVKSSEVGF